MFLPLSRSPPRIAFRMVDGVVGAQMREPSVERAHIVYVNGAAPFVEAVQPFRVVGEAREEAA